MWTALLIIGIYAWLFKRRKKITKKCVAKLTPIFLLFISTAGICKAQSPVITISGEIITTLQNQGKIVVFLIDENSFETPLTGIDTAIINPSGNVVFFKFRAKEKGVYGIRCFHDINNNGILDKRMFFPTEPYGFSWRAGKKFPFNFTDISFNADSNKHITIKMED